MDKIVKQLYFRQVILKDYSSHFIYLAILYILHVGRLCELCSDILKIKIIKLYLCLRLLNLIIKYGMLILYRYSFMTNFQCHFIVKVFKFLV